MEFKGTKGKWELSGELYDNVNPIEVFSGEKTIVKMVAYEFWNVSIEECNANAKLIAAAPEMFEMLNSIKKHLEENRNKNYMIELMYREFYIKIKQLLTKIT